MAQFTVTGEIDPFLHISLLQGEKIYCESNAMVMMESALDLKGKMTGGLGSALMRRFANDESFFQQHIEAVRGGGRLFVITDITWGYSSLRGGRYEL